jgi:hypothetical protein
MNSHYLKYLKYKNKYKNSKFILNGGMKEVEFELHGTMLTTDIPNDFICPISHEIMEDPVITCDGYSYEKIHITQWIRQRPANPLTNVLLPNVNLIPNHSLKGAIIDFTESIYTKKLLELTQLAEQNNSNAQYELGVMYSKYPPDMEKSMYWLNKAVEQHHEQAQHEIIQINERLERERLERERLERLERERLERERLERLERERLERERLERERLGRERLERERLESLLERNRLERERLERERPERERLERERLERVKREKLERLETKRLERRARGIIDTITEKEKRKLLLRADTVNYEYIEELIAKYGPNTKNIIFDILISGRAKSFDLLSELFANYPELITEENFNRIIALDPPIPQNQNQEHIIMANNPFYKPRDREKIILDLITTYPRLVTEHNIEIIRQYITLETDHINRLKTFYRESGLDDHPEVITKITDLNRKQFLLNSIRQLL